MTSEVDPFGWVGATINDKYRVDAFVDEGGFGAVYRGFHLDLGPIAIKFINIQPGLNDAQRQKVVQNLLNEARTLRQLSTQTAGIVQVHDFGAAISPRGRWTPYIVMEWLEGKTLKAEIEERRKAGLRPKGIEEAHRLLTPAAQALGIAHKNNVSHRDIKPANLFLIQSPDGVGMKVLDFGIAKVVSQAPTRSSTLGAFTPPYGAPEQFSREHGTTGLSTDVFAMALTLLEVASGKCVLQGLTVTDLYHSARDVHRRPGLLRGIAPEQSPIADVLRRALSPDPSARHRDLGELWMDLDYAMPSLCDSHPTPLPLSVRGESRVCTVMLVQLTNVGALHARLDPTEVAEIVDRCLAAVTDQAKQLGGVVERSGLDRAIVLFGALHAMDKHAERAVVAALRGLAALGRVALPPAARSVTLSAVIAINSGRMFVRKDRRQVLSVIGEAVTVAEHLLKIAPPGAIVIGRDTYQPIASHFNVEPLPPIPHPEHAEPLLCYRVKGSIVFNASFASTDFHGIKTKLVGRIAERQQIVDAFETMLSERRAQLVTLIGAPGMGRSRLLADFFSHLATRKEIVLVLTGRCSPLFADTSYSLTAALLRQRFGLDDRDVPLEIQRKLRVGMRWFRDRWMSGKGLADEGLPVIPALEDPPEPAALVAALDQTAGIITCADTEVQLDTGSIDDSRTQMKKRSTEAVLLLARFVTRRAPIVLLCDDIQWADDASLDLLEALVQRGEGLPVLVVCSAHPELLDRRPDWGRGAEAYQPIRIGRLRPPTMEEMADDLLRSIPDRPAELIHVIADRAEGNPLILREMLDYLVDMGEIEVRGEEPWVCHARPDALRLPPTVYAMVQARLDRLEPDAREVLLQAAVVGRSFLHGAVDRLRRAASVGPRARSTEVILQQLRDRGFVASCAQSAIPGERESMFVEAVMHEVAYHQLVGAKVRRAEHLLVAEWLEQRANSPAGAALLAHHYDQGGDAKRAAAAYVRAAAHATSFGDTVAALRHLERARVIHDEARGKSEREGGAERRIATFPDRVRLRLELGDAQRRAGKLDDAERSYTEARDLLFWADRRALEGVAKAEALRWEAYVDARLALLYVLRGSLPEARALCDRASARAAEAGASADLAEMYRGLAEAELGCGQISAAIEAGERALSIAETRGCAVLGDAAMTLARVLVRASLGDAGLGERVKAARAALDASLARHFEGDELRGRAEACRALLSRAPGPI